MVFIDIYIFLIGSQIKTGTHAGLTQFCCKLLAVLSKSEFCLKVKMISICINESLANDLWRYHYVVSQYVVSPCLRSGERCTVQCQRMGSSWSDSRLVSYQVGVLATRLSEHQNWNYSCWNSRTRQHVLSVSALNPAPRFNEEEGTMNKVMLRG